jgi:pyruvate/2-oxoglutarate dehydrogenase complex dihydrolipoamide dehydrogenase (E3) component
LGTGRFIGPKVIEVREDRGDVRHLTAEKIFINAGTRPAQPSIQGLDEAGPLNSESIQRLNELPDHLIVLGGGYVGLEFAQMFRHFGSKVTVVEREVEAGVEPQDKHARVEQLRKKGRDRGDGWVGPLTR